MSLNFLFYLSFICIFDRLLQILFYILEEWLQMFVLMLVFRPFILPHVGK